MQLGFPGSGLGGEDHSRTFNEELWGSAPVREERWHDRTEEEVQF